MSQYQTLLADFQVMRTAIQRLSMTEMTDEQVSIINEINHKGSDITKHLVDEYVDFEEICDKLPDAIYVADKNGTTIYVNDMYQRMSGISKSEVLGENIHHINREKKLYQNGVLPTVLRTKKHTEQVGVMVRTNTTVYITGFPMFDSEGNLKYAVAHDRDIQQLETVKDQLITLKETQEMKDDEVKYLRTQQLKNDEMICVSPRMHQAMTTVMAVAPTDATVLITGESGTGKENIANQIYKNSKRADQPFLKINCAAIPDTLMESELFGYVGGSFTGANKKGKTGIFELANKGTLMLDEIGEMSLAMQSKLLRVLQNHEITRVGDSKAIPVDVRIIAATNRDLLKCIADHTFREDLYYRLNVVPIQLPPLRERPEDIETLIHHFLDKYNKKYNKHLEIYTDAVTVMKNYGWPGNIRELQNVIERLVVINDTGAIDGAVVSRVLGISDNVAVSPVSEEDYTLKEATARLECSLIRHALKQYPSKRQAARVLGIDHSTLVKKCQKYGI